MNAYTITLRFASAKARDWYIGQLSDGFGENEAEMDFTGYESHRPDGGTIAVRPSGDAWEHHLRMVKLYPSLGRSAK